ncbi:hypothetical protein HMPREF9241_01242 [Schaalia turicensis ACS-279-V-Col4]|uniref:HTH merR-type domain-containing protein n=1 Tax=Schaalia turicensis ACS-279-V-Col4 TaxID=883077 RepID=K0YQH1_9ACTO|nr:MerR family transcriptional regulator [Schaalia turicensis]EJZ85698.1 hypothetical protein HMPREF9241_01242 [Schaalia turicensis ACS-279-V-Col4]
MPRAHLASSADSGVDAPLTVTAVSVRLGISPSTLRTWERRYGLGPDERQAGTHRRYRASDVARLTAMVDLVHQGVSPADAAATVLATTPARSRQEDLPVPHTVSELLNCVSACHGHQLKNVLRSAVGDEGLVHTWSRLVSPALDTLRASTCGQKPGCAPSTILQNAFLDVLAQFASECVSPQTAPGAVVVLTDVAHELGAHVLGVALGWYGIDVRVVSTATVDDQGACARVALHTEERPVVLAIVMGSGATCEKFIHGLTADLDLDVMLVGADAPKVVDERVLRVRTIAAGVEETLAVLAPGVDLSSVVS